MGLGLLRLPASEFWRMTPREMSLAMRANSGGSAGPMQRSNLAALMQRFPDHEDQSP